MTVERDQTYESSPRSSSGTETTSRMARRPSTSPRIRELARRFEVHEQGRQRESLPLMSVQRPQTVRISLGDLDWTPRRVVTRISPVAATAEEVTLPTYAHQSTSRTPRSSAPLATPPPLYEEPRQSTRQSTILSEVHTDRRIIPRDGLPTLSDEPILHIHLHDCERDAYPVQSQVSELKEGSFSVNSSDDEEDKTIANECFSTTNLSNLASYKPFPTHQIFAYNAFPLHLPRLDRHLADSELFAAPRFSDAQKLYSKEESALYQWLDETKYDKHRMEVCGAQLRVSKIQSHERTQTGLRQRGRTRRQDLDEAAGDDDEAQPLSGQNQDAEKLTTQRDDPCDHSRPHCDARSQKIPPLMLLEDNTLDELKSNAIGPRKAPGGFLSYFPGLASFLGIIVDFVIGIEGSSMAAGIFRLQLFIDFVQLTRLNSPAVEVISSDSTNLQKVNSFMLVSLPSFLALDFVSVFGYAILIFLGWTLLAALLLLCFWRMIHKYNPNKSFEGYRSQPWLFRPFSRSSKEGNRTQAPLSQSSIRPYKSTAWSKFANISLVTLLTILYIPLGKLSLDALVWNSDYWPVGSLSLFTGNPELYRDPSRVCYTTTMRRDELNWAYVIVLMAILTTLFYTLWFPFAMRRAITPLLPRITKYNELGQPRSSDEMDAEYIRLLGRDSSPLCFLYNAYRRKWGNYKPLYLLLFKFSNMVIISILAQDNCLWRQYQPKTMLVTQESVLIVFQSILLVAHIIILPFVDQIGNRSELVSRAGYVVNSIFGLLVALNIKYSFLFNTWLLYIVYAITYTLNFYFAFASTVIVSHWIKKFQSRIDFSIDIFSPNLQLDKHIKRRVWQETLSIVLLTGGEYHMPLDQLVTFSVLDESCPPVLISFQGSIAERHVENLKIIKQVGLDAYKKACEDLRGKEALRWRQVMKCIELDHCGPDAYWRPSIGLTPSSVTTFFGKALWIPFPPTIAFDYDQVFEEESRLVKLTTLEEMEAFVHQNSTEVVQRRKWVRMVLRAMDGQRVYCPHTASVRYKSNVFANNLGFAGRDGEYSLAKTMYYSEGILHIRKKLTGGLQGDHLQAGFDVSITYEYGQSKDAEGTSVKRKKLVVNAANAFGLSDDFDLTTSVQRFFHANNDTIQMRLPLVHSVIKNYRHVIHAEGKAKHMIMDYSFHADIFDKPILSQAGLHHTFRQARCDDALRQLPQRYPATMTLLLERLNILAQSNVHKWWYLFWDDLWRKNSGDYKALRSHQSIFCPQFTSSLAWQPMPRAKLEEILTRCKGLWSEGKRKRAIFTPGLLNQIYFALEEIAFAQPHHDAIQLGVADSLGLPHKTSASQLSSFPHSSLTGGGTDHDEVSVLNRHQWAWTEQRLGPSSNGGLGQKMRRFLALSPYVPNRNVEEVWIYARFIEGEDGQAWYEAERSWDDKRGKL